MRKLFILIIVLSLSVTCSKKEQKTISAKLSFLKGDVTVTRQGASQKAVLNMRLTQDDVVKTGPDSEVNILFANIGVSKIKQNSEIIIKSIFETVDGETIIINASKGKIFSALKKLSKDKSSFEIHTPTAVAGVRGTTFLVIVVPGKHSRIGVFSGSVEIKKLGQPEKSIPLSELKEALVPVEDFDKTKVENMKDATFKEVGSLEELKEIDEEAFKEIKAEIAKFRAKWKEMGAKKKDDPLRW